jgi:Golgi nucleoside diphosphatase
MATFSSHKGLLLWTLILSASALIACADDAEFEYGAIIDAGSSGSRISLYRWPTRRSSSSSAPPLTVEQLFAYSNSSTVPALSSFANNPNQAGDSLNELLQRAADKAKSVGANTQNIPIFLKATAGMRTLPPDNVTAYVVRSNCFP